MASIAKLQNSKQEVQERGNEEDRISNLPDNIIGHILSFIPTKYAVRTSVLSTKWKLNWTLITNINIDSGYRGFRNSTPLHRMNFMNFVYRVQQQCRVACMHKFRLHCSMEFDVSHVNAWVTAALARNFQEFNLRIVLTESGFVSRDLLTRRNLVKLKLGSGFLLNVPDSVSLPSLKILRLIEMKFLNDESLNRLFLGCPVLEELHMEGDVGHNVCVLNISAPLLKRLIISYLLVDSGSDAFKIVLDTPCLLYLEIDDYMADDFSVQKLLHHLVEARIELQLAPDLSYNCNYGESLTVLLEAISEVQVLHISSDFLEAIEKSSPMLPMFHHATSLEIDGCMGYDDWKPLLHLLDSLPHLQTLVFAEGCRNWDRSLPINWYPPQNVPSCLLCQLKVIEIHNHLKDADLELVKYFLKNSIVLKKLTVDRTFIPQGMELKITEELMRIPRQSSCCHVEVL